jgi:hypothetical protein
VRSSTRETVDARRDYAPDVHRPLGASDDRAVAGMVWPQYCAAINADVEPFHGEGIVDQGDDDVIASCGARTVDDEEIIGANPCTRHRLAIDADYEGRVGVSNEHLEQVDGFLVGVGGNRLACGYDSGGEGRESG